MTQPFCKRHAGDDGRQEGMMSRQCCSNCRYGRYPPEDSISYSCSTVFCIVFNEVGDEDDVCYEFKEKYYDEDT